LEAELEELGLEAELEELGLELEEELPFRFLF
jgi:hypothetical protein